MSTSPTRRQFMTAAVAAGLAPSAAPAAWRRRRQVVCPPVCPPQPLPPQCCIRTRPNIASMSPAQLESLRRGVAAMRALPDTDPRSWMFQASIHGTTGPATNPLFNQCEHGTLQFFTWHRGYLYFFERILRWAAQDPCLNLPFWDWTAHPVLPEPFRNPANASNPLYETLRQANDGSALPQMVVVDDLDNAMNQTTFPPAPGPVGFSPRLEGSPHGAVHVLVGGFGGLMSSVPRAARDPIFWLHHGNIDRLWNVWLNRGGGRANPTDAAFLDQTYSFADESGQTVTVRVRDIIDSARLCYQYEGVPNPQLFLAGYADEPKRAVDAPVVASSVEDRAAALDKLPAKPLVFQTEVVKLQTVKDERAALTRAFASPSAGPVKSRVLVAIEGVSADQAPGFLFAVYLNLPEGKLSDAERRNYHVGSINFFGRTRAEQKKGGGHDHGDEFTETLDATEVVARLQAGKKWDPDALTVTILPVASLPPGAKEDEVRAHAAAAAKEAKVTYKRVTVRVTP